MGALKLQEATLKELRKLAQRHQVTYSVDPALEMIGNSRVVIGYDVELIGAHPPHARVLPGCSQCKLIWDDLERIGDAIRGQLEGRASVTRSSRFAPTLTSSRAPDGSPRDEVRLALSLRHRTSYFDPVDRCEQICLEDIVDTLRLANVRPNRTR